MNLPFAKNKLQTPYYLVDEALLISNLERLKDVSERAGCKILLAQKAFSMFSLYPLIGRYLAGTTASGLYEAKLGYEEMGGETHVFSPAYRPDEFDEILEICDHIVFNSFSQWERYREKSMASGKSIGLRINPEHSTQVHAMYDPCSPGSRLGITLANFKSDLLEGIEGLHFHTLCEQNSDDLVTTLAAIEDKFGSWLKQMKWINFGGGHHITRADYDVDLLVDTIIKFKERYQVEVYLEPGEAIALNTGYLVTTVLDLIENDGDIAILDTSATCHMPDVLEMPYRPMIIGSAEPGIKAFTYRLGGPTCLAGDEIGSYSFDQSLQVGDQLIFLDMAIYTMVKTTTFNGMGLPSIAVATTEGEVKLIRNFSYEDFKTRLS